MTGAVYNPSHPNFPDLRIEKYNPDGAAQWSQTINMGIGFFSVSTGKFGDIYTSYFAQKDASSPVQAHLVKYQGDDYDSDGDGLMDRWETYGVYVGNTFIDLPAMGADPNHKDVFVQVDSMTGEEPKAGAFDIVVNAFKKGPVWNPDGKPGINLHVDAGYGSVMNPNTGETWGLLSRSHQGLPNTEILGSVSSKEYQWDDFDAIKSANFDKSRAPVFHYCLFANRLGGLGTTSGISRDIPASDFIVSLGGWGSVTALQQAGTFMHELGHNLGLRHGGVDDISYKPNYLSVMNYSFQTGGLIEKDASGRYVNGSFDYSIFDDLNDLDEGSLDESAGLASASGNPALQNYGTIFYWDNVTSPGHLEEIDWSQAPQQIDWNNNLRIDTDNVWVPFLAVGPDEKGSYDVYLPAGGEDWDRLEFTGGAIGALGAWSLPQETPADTEYTWEDEQAQGHLYYVVVTAPQNSRAKPGGSNVTYKFTVTNTGKNADIYSVNATSSAGWADLSAFPQTVALSPGQSENISMFARKTVTGEQRQVYSGILGYRYDFTMSIYGTRVVYVDFSGRIMLYDLSDNTTRVLASSDSDPYNPSIDGDKVVYVAQEDVSGPQIFMYDLSTATERQITHDNYDNKSFPDISGDKIVWEDERNDTTPYQTNHDVYMYDLSTNTERAICTNDRNQLNVRIDGDKIVWDDDRNYDPRSQVGYDIYMYDLSTNTETPVTNHSADGQKDAPRPSISNNRIAGLGDYCPSAPYGNELLMYDTETGAETLISSHVDDWRPFINGNEIAYWKRFTSGSTSYDALCVFDLSVAPETSVTTLPPAAGADGWFTTVPSITLTPDTPGVSTFYQWDSVADTGWSGYSGNFTAPEGQHTLYYYSADDLGNTESVKRQVFKVDTTPPVTGISTTPSFGQIIDNVFKVLPQIALSTGEAGSTSYYQWDSSSGPWTTYSGTFAGQPGQHTLYCYSVDSHGNAEAAKSQIFNVDTAQDTSPPFTTISVNPPLGASQRYFDSSPVITLTANETAVTYYSWDVPMNGIPSPAGLPDMSGAGAYGPTQGPTLYLGQFLAPASRHILYYFSVDAAGNIEPLKSATLVVGDFPPVADDQTVTTSMNTPVDITLTATDPDSDNMTFIVVTQPVHGALSGASENLTYTPSDNFTGSDNFTFKACDSQADSNIATVTITVRPPDRPPVADNDTYSVTQGHALNVAAPGVLTNDTDPDGDALTAALVTTSGNGTLNLNANGSFTYTPSANFTGTDNFTYKASDGQLDSNVATVTITVTAGTVNHPPVASNQGVSTVMNTPAHLVLTALDQDGDSLTFAVVSPPAHGNLSGTPPTLMYSPAAGFAGNDSFTFKANDGQADSNVALVAITVSAPAVNYPPVYVAPPPQISVNPPLSIVGDQLMITGSGFAANEPVTLYLDGNVIGNARTDSIGALPETDLKLPPTAHGNHTIKVTDAAGHSASATFSTKQQITISPYSGPCATTVTVKGTGFNADAAVTLTFGDAAVSGPVVTTDASGSFGPVTITVPASASGAHDVKASDGADVDGKSFRVSASATVIPTEGYVGSEFTVEGTGFVAGEEVSILFDNSLAKSVTADANGSFSTPVDVPAKPAATYTVRVRDAANSMDTDFAVTTSVSMSPASSGTAPGFVGQQVTVKGVGFAAGNTVAIAYDGQQVATGAVAADNTFSIPFTVPASKAGDHTVTVKDSLNNLPLTFVMDSTPPPAPTLVTPDDGSPAKASPTFDWTEVTDPSGVTYNLQVATSPDFNPESIVMQKTGLTACECSLSGPDKLKPAAYYWRVQAVDGASNAAAYSTARSFRMASGLPLWAIIVIIVVAAALIGLLAFFWSRRRRNAADTE